MQRFQDFLAAGVGAGGEGHLAPGGVEGGMSPGARFDCTVSEPVPDRMLGAALVCCGGEKAAALAYLRDLVVESSMQVLAGDSVEELEEVSKDDEFCIENEELCIKNEELCIYNDEFCRRRQNGEPSRTGARCILRWKQMARERRLTIPRATPAHRRRARSATATRSCACCGLLTRHWRPAWRRWTTATMRAPHSRRRSSGRRHSR